MLPFFNHSLVTQASGVASSSSIIFAGPEVRMAELCFPGSSSVPVLGWMYFLGLSGHWGPHHHQNRQWSLISSLSILRCISFWSINLYMSSSLKSLTLHFSLPVASPLNSGTAWGRAGKKTLLGMSETKAALCVSSVFNVILSLGQSAPFSLGPTFLLPFLNCMRFYWPVTSYLYQ